METLNLYGTNVTDTVLEPLKSLPRLHKLYLWKTQVTYDAVVTLEQVKPGLEWNLGWDHPVIARQRLEKQKTEFTELLKKAEADTARLKTDLKVAEEAHAATQKRLQEVEESLKKLVDDQAAETPTAKAANELRVIAVISPYALTSCILHRWTGCVLAVWLWTWTACIFQLTWRTSVGTFPVR